MAPAQVPSTYELASVLPDCVDPRFNQDVVTMDADTVDADAAEAEEMADYAAGIATADAVAKDTNATEAVATYRHAMGEMGAVETDADATDVAATDVRNSGPPPGLPNLPAVQIQLG